MVLEGLFLEKVAISFIKSVNCLPLGFKVFEKIATFWYASFCNTGFYTACRSDLAKFWRQVRII